MTKASYPAIFSIALIMGCSSSQPEHSAEDYRNATFYDVNTSVYQEAEENDTFVEASGKLRFADGSISKVTATIRYMEAVDDPKGYCEFEKFDSYELFTNIAAVGSGKIVKPCTKGAEPFEVTIWRTKLLIGGYIATPESDFPIPHFHIDSLRYSGKVDYYRGYDPDADSQKPDDNDHN